MAKDLLSLVDAAYAVDADETTWLKGVAGAARTVLDAGFGMFSVLYDASNPDQVQLRSTVVEGLPETLQPVLGRHMQLFDRAWVHDTFLDFTCDHIRNPRLARHAAGDPRTLDELYAPYGVHDILGINALDPQGLGCQINVLLPRRCRLTPAVRTRWSRVAAHIAAGNRLRRRLAQARDLVPEAVLAAEGKLLHAEGEAKSRDAREELISAARSRENARGKLRRADPDRAIAEWKGLVAARWTLVDQFESDGRRFLVAQKNDPDVAGVESLTARERCAVGFAALGHSNKLIAYEMGIKASTVSVLLLRAARRLRAGSRRQLIDLFLAQRG